MLVLHRDVTLVWYHFNKITPASLLGKQREMKNILTISSYISIHAVPSDLAYSYILTIRSLPSV